MSWRPMTRNWLGFTKWLIQDKKTWEAESQSEYGGMQEFEPEVAKDVCGAAKEDSDKLEGNLS